MCLFLEDGRGASGDNPVEYAMRPIDVSRRNRPVTGDEAFTGATTLIERVNINGLKPDTLLRKSLGC